MKGRFIWIFSAIIACCLMWNQGAFAKSVDCSDPVNIEQGKLEGFKDGESDTCAYLGIPFAAPPVGDLRWKAPMEPQSWDGVRKATDFGPWCMQVEGLDTMSGKHTQSEDCLYLNVWRPKKEGKFPVMVWIHGGGYMSGSSSLDMYRGERLAEQGDVVVVTTNYRMNVFGFLAHKELAAEDPHNSTGNYGSLDQVAALKWVQKNISVMGGDPDNVTIFGESAGGWSVCTMVATPLTKGLFHRAILESGSCQESKSVERGHEHAVGLVKKLRCSPGDMDCMRTVPAKELMKAAWVGLDADKYGDLTFINHHDGHLLDKTPLETIRAGEHNAVPMILGSNRDEARALITLNPKYDFLSNRRYKKAVRKTFPDHYEKILEVYPRENFPKPIDALAQVVTDVLLGCPGYTAAEALARQPEPLYYYRFDYDDIRLPKRLGAFHGLEIAFVFEAFDRKPLSLAFKKKHIAQAQVLSDKVMAYWTAFAKTGDPNSAEGLPRWPAFDPDGKRSRLLIDNTLTVQSVPMSHDDQCEVLEQVPRFNLP